MKSNNDPSVPAKLYLDTVQSLKGCPRIVRSDCGTENVTLAAIQCSLRDNNPTKIFFYNGELVFYMPIKQTSKFNK